MRRLALAAVLVMVAGGSAWAARSDQHVLGHEVCGAPFSCPSFFGHSQTEALIAAANQCLRSYYFYRSSSSAFEDALGFDSDHCLTSKHEEDDSSGNTTKSKTTLKCCVVPIDAQGNACQLQCDKVYQAQ